MTSASATSPVLEDPMVIFELLTLMLTFLYLVRLSFGSPQSPDIDSSSTSRRRAQPRRILTFFAVGALISLPKRSLRGQGWRMLA